MASNLTSAIRQNRAKFKAYHQFCRGSENLLWRLDKLIHFRSDKLRRSFTQQRRDGLVISRLLPRL